MFLHHMLICMLIIFGTLPGYILDDRQKSHGKVEIDDFSRLNKTTIHTFVTPRSYDEFQDLVTYAKKHNLKVSIAGIQHSQGGQSFYDNAIVVNLKKLNKVIHFDPHKQLITVQAGATWKEIQEYLNPYTFAVKIMQFANLFTVGGSLSVNCNGVDPQHGPLIESVHSIKIMCADGSIKQASRIENSELFHLAIGGYGLFGIILEATLEIVPNSVYKRETKLMSLAEYATYIKQISNDPNIGFHFAFLPINPIGKKLFGHVAAFNFKEIDQHTLSSRQKRKTRKLYRERCIGFKRNGTYLWTKSRLIKALHWVPEGLKHGKLISRNNIMRPPASHLYVELPDQTNLLQEYFIPVDNLIAFIESLEKITKQLNLNLMHIAFRYIPQNTESFLSYTKQDCVGVVLFFNQPMTVAGNRKTETWTKHLIDTAIELHGTYYLAIQLHADNQQIALAHPEIREFFRLKKQYDPNEMFTNHFYERYARAKA